MTFFVNPQKIHTTKEDHVFSLSDKGANGPGFLQECLHCNKSIEPCGAVGILIPRLHS